MTATVITAGIGLGSVLRERNPFCNHYCNHYAERNLKNHEIRHVQAFSRKVGVHISIGIFASGKIGRVSPIRRSTKAPCRCVEGRCAPIDRKGRVFRLRRVAAIDQIRGGRLHCGLGFAVPFANTFTAGEWAPRSHSPPERESIPADLSEKGGGSLPLRCMRNCGWADKRGSGASVPRDKAAQSKFLGGSAWPYCCGRSFLARQTAGIHNDKLADQI